MRSCKKSNEDLKSECQKAENTIHDVEESRSSILTELEGVRSTAVQLEEKIRNQKIEMENTVEAYKLEAANKYEEGFNAGIKQAEVIAPEVDFSEADAWKEIIDGKFVSPPPTEFLNVQAKDQPFLADNSVEEIAAGNTTNTTTLEMNLNPVVTSVNDPTD